MSKTNNAVLATGGGIVTKPANMALLKQPDSFIVYIHRDFYKLATTPKRVMEKRPILQHTSYDKLLALYKQRLPLYRQYADCEVKNDKNRDESTRAILQELDRILLNKPEEEQL
jgi:shikimate kinase